MNALIEGGVGAQQGVQRERADHVGRIHQRLPLEHRQRAQRQHCLRAIDERDGFFGFQHHRLDLRALQSLGAGRRLAFKEDFAFTDKRQRQMGERRQIAACANAALRGNHRMHAAVEHLAESIHQQRAYPAVSLG